MTDFIPHFFEQIAATSLAEWVAVVLALAYVWLAARQNRWCWLCAFISTAIYTWLFWQVTLPFQAILNLYYMMMAGYGYYQWNRQAAGDDRVHSWPWYTHAMLVPGLLLIAWGLSLGIAWGLSPRRLTAAYPLEIAWGLSYEAMA